MNLLIPKLVIYAICGSVVLGASCRGSSQPATHSEERLSLLMPDDFEALHLVGWRVEVGTPDSNNPLIEPGFPWDSGGIMAHGTVARDPIDGLWKAWQVSTPDETELAGLKAVHEHRRRLTYLESKDGVTWERPMLPLVKWPGYDRTNILLDLESGGTAVYASVLIDPSNGEYPYEMFVMRSPQLAGTENRVGHLPGPTKKLGTYRYVSKDGKEWIVKEGPVDALPHGDVCYVYRQSDGSYVSYFKAYPPLEAGARIIVYDVNALQLQRSVGRRVSPNGSDWGDEKVVFRRDWRDPDYAQYLELTRIAVPGGYLGFVTNYDAVTQCLALEMVASRDGINWWRPDRRKALGNAALGDYGGGMIWQMHSPIREGNKLHVYYAGTEGIHSAIVDTRFEPQIEVGNEKLLGFRKGTLPFYSALCRASWEYDRLYALASAVGGPMPAEAVTRARSDLGNSTILVNVRVKDKGKFRAELLDGDGKPVPGFTLEDSVPITGDYRSAPLRWTGGDVAPVSACKVRFVFNRAFLYGFEPRERDGK